MTDEQISSDPNGHGAMAGVIDGAVERDAPTTQTDESAPEATARWYRWEPLVDSVIVTVLAIASLAAAWSGYQSARWDGVQAASYNQASAHRVESARSSTYGHQLAIVDIITFTSYMDAYIKGDTELADFYMNRFRAGFRPAFDAWMATDPLNNPDAPPSPFAMPEYVVPELQEADRLEAEASVLFQKGQDANQTSDDYVLNTVFLATVLFFAAIAPRVGWVPARVTLITVACLMLAVGLYNVSTYPIE